MHDAARQNQSNKQGNCSGDSIASQQYSNGPLAPFARRATVLAGSIEAAAVGMIQCGGHSINHPCLPIPALNVACALLASFARSR